MMSIIIKLFFPDPDIFFPIKVAMDQFVSCFMFIIANYKYLATKFCCFSLINLSFHCIQLHNQMSSKFLRSLFNNDLVAPYF